MIDDSKKLAMIYQAVGLAGGPEQTVEEHLEHCDLHFLRVLHWIFDKEPQVVLGVTADCTDIKPSCTCSGT